MSSFIARTRRFAVPLAALALLAACQEPAGIAGGAAASRQVTANPSQAGATVAWNQVARGLVAKYGTSAHAAIRMFALLSVAQYNAIVQAEKATTGSPHSVDDGAVAGASAAVLTYIYPQEEAFLEGLVYEHQGSPAAPGGGPRAIVSGETIGRAIAAAIISRAETDRYFEPFTGSVPVCPGCWLPEPSQPAFATLGQAKPFLLTSGAQFRPPPPPAFGSAEFLSALAEVRQIADTRTAEQDSIAKFWALPAGTITAQGYFNKLGAELALKYHRTERETAHALALLNIAAFDAIIASHEAKYYYWLIRPSQADPLIVRAIGLPSFPAYPSNHSALAAAAATVLGALFPSERAPLNAMAEEAAISRLYGGIHFRFDTDAGLALGRSVGTWTLAHDVVGHEPFKLQ